MRRLLEQLRTGLDSFVVQRDDLVLLLACSDSDSAMVSMALGAQDEASGSELYWCVVEAFEEPRSFVDACVSAFAAKHDAARLALAQGGAASLPELPAAIADPQALEPVVRLRRLIVFSRSLLPELTGCSAVWGFVPGRIDDPKAYAVFMSEVWAHEFPFPWCHHARFVVRDTFPQSAWGGRAEKAPRVRHQVLDLSPPALEQALADDAADDAAPLADRVNSALILAGIDYSHARYERAIQQYDIVHRYAAATGNATLAAIALNGLGESHRATGDAARAGDFLQAALGPAAQADAPPVPVLLILYMNLGELRLEQERWAEAEVFLHGAAEFALLLHEPERRLHAWKLLGRARHRQGNAEGALQAWSDGAIVAGRLDRHEEHAEFVTLLREHFVALRDEMGFRTMLWRVEDEIKSGKPTARADAPDHAGVA